VFVQRGVAAKVLCPAGGCDPKSGMIALSGALILCFPKAQLVL